MLAFASGIIAGAVLYHYCTNKKEVFEHSPGRKQTAPPTQNVKNANCLQDVPAQTVTFNCQTARSASVATSRFPSSSIRTATLANTIRTAERRQSPARAVIPSPAPAPPGHISQVELVSLPDEMVATAELLEPETLIAIQ